MLTLDQVKTIYPSASIAKTRCRVFKNSDGKPSLGLFENEVGKTVIKQTTSNKWYLFNSLTPSSDMMGSKGKYEIPLEMLSEITEDALNNAVPDIKIDLGTKVNKTFDGVKQQDVVPDFIKVQPTIQTNSFDLISDINNIIRKLNEGKLIDTNNIIATLIKAKNQINKLNMELESTHVLISNGVVVDKSEHVYVIQN